MLFKCELRCFLLLRSVQYVNTKTLIVYVKNNYFIVYEAPCFDLFFLRIEN